MKKLNATQNQTHYCLCPRCGRATPVAAEERFCPNDATKLLITCIQCNAKLFHLTGDFAVGTVMALIGPCQHNPERKVNTYLTKLETTNGARLGIDQ